MYGGDASWPHSLEVKDGAVYCARFDESRTLQEELAAKAQIRIAPGTYPLPGQDQAGLALPACELLAENGTPIAIATGNATYTTSTYQTETTHSYAFVQPITTNPPGGTLTIDLSRTVTAPPVDLVLDGTEDAVFDSAQSYSFMWCPAGVNCYPNRIFDSCTHAGSRLHTHVVTFSGGAGDVTFELRIGQSFASTEPGAFVRAHGTYQGTAFDQTNYWKLVYNPEHHHFTRNFAVLFDAPIGGACGIEVSGLEPFTDDFVTDEAFTVGCSLDRIDPVTVASHVHTADP